MTLHRGGDDAQRQLALIRERQLRKPADLPVLLGPGHLIGHLLPQHADQLVIDANLTHEPIPSIVDATPSSLPAAEPPAPAGVGAGISAGHDAKTDSAIT